MRNNTNRNKKHKPIRNRGSIMERETYAQLDRIEAKITYLIELITTPEKLPENENEENETRIKQKPIDE